MSRMHTDDRYCGARRMLLPARPSFRFPVLRWLLAAAIVLALCLMRFGGDLLVASDPAPGHVDAGIVLQGSIAAQKVRIAGAVNLLQRGVADRVLVSVPKNLSGARPSRPWPAPTSNALTVPNWRPGSISARPAAR